MKKSTLPRDLRNFSNKKLFQRLIPCAILLLILSILVVFFSNSIFPSDSELYRIKELIIILSIIIICWITGVPFKINDRTFFGQIEKVAITTVTDSDVPGRLSIDLFHTDNVVTLRIRTLSGRIISKTIYRAKVKKSEFLDMYKAGDKVFHLYGSYHIVNISNTNNIKCSVCGKENHRTDDHCVSCSHTLIKSLPSENL